MSEHFARAQMLLQHGKHELAEKELRLALATDPNDASAHAALALCLSAREKCDEAESEAREAIHLAPDEPYPHYTQAVVCFQRNRFGEALQSIDEAIRIQPADADYFALKSQIYLSKRDWQSALGAAESGLELDAEHVSCTNMRAIALVKLDRPHEAGQTIDAALGRDPEDALSHANQGWTLLDRGDPKKAMEHFREALRLNPEMEWAREGIVEALKSHNFIYRWMLRYFLWMSKLDSGKQWMIIIGGYIAYRFLAATAKTNPQLAPFLWPFMGLYLGFAVMTWVAYPLFNLLLRLNRFGRLALSREQIFETNWFGGCIIVGLLTLATGLALKMAGVIIAGIGFLVLVIPLSGTFRCHEGWPRRVMAFYTLALAIGIAAIGWLMTLKSPMAETVLTLVAVGLFASQFLANILAGMTPTK